MEGTKLDFFLVVYGVVTSRCRDGTWYDLRRPWWATAVQGVSQRLHHRRRPIEASTCPFLLIDACSVLNPEIFIFSFSYTRVCEK